MTVVLVACIIVSVGILIAMAVSAVVSAHRASQQSAKNPIDSLEIETDPFMLQILNETMEEGIVSYVDGVKQDVSYLKRQ